MRIVRWAARTADELVTDARYAVRTWCRQPGLALVAVISLAAGIGLNTAVFSIINTIFLQSIRGVPEPARVVTVGGRSPFAAFREIRDRAEAFEGVAAWQPLAAEIRFRGHALRGTVPAVSENYFHVLGVRPALGRMFEPVQARTPSAERAVVLDYEFWARTLGRDPTVLGETLLIGGSPATIVGVSPRAFHGFGPERPPLWVTMGTAPAIRKTAPRWDDPGENGWRIVGRLRAGLDVAAANAELRLLAARAPDVFPHGPLQAASGPERWNGPVSAEKHIEFLLVVVLPLVVAGLILWIGCSNVANLLLARGAARRKEIAIRMASGAGRARIVRLLLTESLLLALAGGGLGLLVAAWTLHVVWATLPDAPRLAVEMDARVLLYTALVCLAATLFSGVVPALHATRVDVAPLLKSEDAGALSRRGGRARGFFLVTQFASSTSLLLVAGTFVTAVVSTHLGEEAAAMDHLTLAHMESDAASGPQRAAHWERVRRELGRLPHVAAVTLLPAGGGTRVPLTPEGTPGSTQAEATVHQIDRGFVATTGAAVSAGTADLGPGATVETLPALVNERAARQFWGTPDAVGRRFSAGGSGRLTVVGVVRDDGREARVYRRLRDDDVVQGTVLIRTNVPSTRAVGTLRSVVAELSADRGFARVATLREASTGPLQRLTALAAGVAAVVLALATVGLYGAMSFAMSQRTREIAIRLAIGAPRPRLLRTLAREGLLVVLGGSLLGLLATAVAFRFMSGMIFARWTLDPATVAGVLAVFAAATLLACYVPGRRAIRLEPMRVLRAD